MFEMLTGQPPFVSENPGDLIAMHMLQPPPPLRSFLPDVDPTLQRMIEAMLGKDPQGRPGMPEVAQQLKALGHLQSDVMPMRVLRDSGNDLRGPTGGFVPLSLPRPAAPAKPEPPAPAPALPPKARPTDPDATVQMRDKQPGGPSSSPGKAAAAPAGGKGASPGPFDMTRHVGLPSDATTAFRADEPVPSGPIPKPFVRTFSRPFQLKQEHMERLVFIGLLVVAALLGILVLLMRSHGEGAQ